ncbi:hypothetical protein K435DRAFT_869544 [Dendrothele bispora CBS 962.96]|uniref:Uncharacterized protein n=1 Tax=Dendrothele bispora (strain CBS 962.96) TaxID=1314807 RepID=A0A4S8L9K8_DENBC|nr:hypothetical protein K435DRAFT_869544 [Dendrothele bispora CBS 962.96]
MRFIVTALFIDGVGDNGQQLLPRILDAAIKVRRTHQARMPNHYCPYIQRDLQHRLLMHINKMGRAQNAAEITETNTGHDGSHPQAQNPTPSNNPLLPVPLTHLFTLMVFLKRMKSLTIVMEYSLTGSEPGRPHHLRAYLVFSHTATNHINHLPISTLTLKRASMTMEGGMNFPEIPVIRPTKTPK